jgi:outer membrane receptor protein involved in Fe transport
MVRADYYWQGASYARIYNTDGDRIHSYNNLNLLFRVSNPDNGLTFDIWGQNVTDEVAITGSYLTDDSSGLFRNIFLTEPRTFGLRVSKTW